MRMREMANSQSFFEIQITEKNNWDNVGDAIKQSPYLVAYDQTQCGQTIHWEYSESDTQLVTNRV